VAPFPDLAEVREGGYVVEVHHGRLQVLLVYLLLLTEATWHRGDMRRRQGMSQSAQGSTASPLRETLHEVRTFVAQAACGRTVGRHLTLILAWQYIVEASGMISQLCL
jgi:hypothetical protein